MRLIKVRWIQGNIDLAYEERVSNQLESELMVASANFQTFPALRWENVRSTLKEKELAIELIQTEIYENGKWTDSTVYIALLLSREMDGPKAVIIENGNELESRSFFYLQ